MYVVFTTVASQETGENLAEKIVLNKLAACVQILPKMTSVYLWEGAVKKEPEHLLLIKTLDTSYKELKEFIIENHDYDVPEIIAFESEKISEDYFSWLTDSLS